MERLASSDIDLVTRTIAFALVRYGAVTLLALIAYLLGRRLLLRQTFGSAAERLAVCGSLGLAALSQVVGALGLLRLLRPEALLGFGVGLVALCWPVWAEGLAAMRHPGKLASSVARWLRSPALWALLAVAIAFYPLWLLPLYPSTDFDATAYHLAVAKAFVRAHAVEPTPLLRFPVGPLNAHVLFALLILVCDDVAANLVSVLSAVLVALGLYAWSADSASPGTGGLAAALFGASSLVLNRAETPSYHMFCALMVTMAVWCLALFGARKERTWLVLSAVFCGLAAGTYYVGLFFVGVLSLAAGWLCWRAGRGRLVLAYAGVALVAASPWLLHNAYYTGNPFWPFLGNVFGLAPWWTPADLAGVMRDLATLGNPRTLVNFLRLPFDLALHPESFQTTGAPSPAFLAALPLVALGTVRDRLVALLSGLVVAYLVFWFFGAQALRYLLPVLPVLCVAVARSWWSALPTRARTSAFLRPRVLVEVALIAALLLPIRAYAIAMATARGPLPTTAPERDDWLARRVRAYRAVQVANLHPGPVYGLGTLWLAAFSEGGFLGDVVGPGRYDRLSIDDSRRLHADLRSLGARYLLLGRPATRGMPTDDESFASRFVVRYTSGTAELFELRDPPTRYPWPPPQRLRNGDFEEGGSGRLPADWEAAGESRVVSEEPFVRSGARGVAVAPHDRLSQTVMVAPGEACTLAAWTRTRRASRMLILEVEWLDRAHSSLYREATEHTIAPRWARVLTRRLAPGRAAQVRVQFATGGGVIFMDDIMLRCLEQPETIGRRLPFEPTEAVLWDRAGSAGTTPTP